MTNNCRFRNYMEGHGSAGSTSHPANAELQSFIDDESGEVKVLNFPARFSQGGSLTVLWTIKEDAYKESKKNAEYQLNDKYKLNNPGDYGDFEPFILVAKKRDVESIHGNYLRASSGLAESPEEDDWTEPSLVIITECFQKMKICDNDDDEVRYIPATIEGFDKISSLTTREIKRRISKVVMGRRKNTGSTESSKLCDDAWLIPLGNDEILISYRGKDYGPTYGRVALDPKYGGVDLMASINLRIMKPLSKLKIYDDENKDREHTCQPVLVFTTDEFANLFKGETAVSQKFFGFENYKEYKGERAILESVSMNPPLFWSGLALLEKLGIKLSEDELKKAKDTFKKDLEDKSVGVEPKFDKK